MNFNLQKLRYERLSRKIPQEKMAKAIGVTRSTYYKKENGYIKISVEEFYIFLKVMDIPISEAGNFFKQNVPERERNKKEAI